MRFNATYIPVLILLSFAVCCFSGCKSRPPKVIAEDEMVSLMADMQLAEAYASTQITGITSYEERKQLGKAILAQHGFTQEDVDSTLSWYGRNLDDYSELFEKVDLEINKRRKKLMANAESVKIDEDLFNLWPYPSHGIISDLGNTDGWIISIPVTDFNRGDRLTWSAFIPSSPNMKATLGVEYADGSAESTTSVFSKPEIKIELQTDTGKIVNRVYGTLSYTDNREKRIMVDSLKLIRSPFDSLQYRSIRSQKKFHSL